LGKLRSRHPPSRRQMEGGANFVVKVMLEAEAVARLTARRKKACGGGAG
jgi:hypothetical protein